jgi:hypothetical protein
MSSQQRREIAYWAMLLAGIALMTMQLIKYGINELEFSFGEITVTVVSVAFMIFPKFILRIFEHFVKSKTNGKNES